MYEGYDEDRIGIAPEWAYTRISELEEENKRLTELKKWVGVMHTPAYGEWDERGFWQRGNHVFGVPQVANMCREMIDALKESK